MNPFYFGPAERPLFGVHHPPKAPRSGGASERGVVLCAAFGQEYMRSHRAFRTLANLLARRGHHVFRFDYFGTGDSSGEGDAGTPEIWLEDVGLAIDELKDNGALDRVSLVGLRLGATLALLAAERRDDVERVALWDPVVDGAAYVRQLLEVAEPPEPDVDGVYGVLGFPLTAGMRAQIEALDLSGAKLGERTEVSILVSSDDPDAIALGKHIDAQGGRVSYRCVPSAGSWNEVDNFGGALVPQEIIGAIVERLSHDSESALQ